MLETANAPFVRNAWYVAAWPHEIKDRPLARTIMNQPLVLFRDGDGKAAALEDRCCHRGAPLTHGRMVPQGIECGYHGLTFDGDGNCVKVPGQDRVPDEARVQAFPVVEKNGIIWIWMGDAALADKSKIVDHPYHDDPEQWPTRKNMYPMKINYMLMVDNLMDLTHLGYVHARTIGGQPATHVAAEMDTERTDTGCKYIRWMEDCDPPPTYKKGGRFEGKIDRWQEFEYVAPCSVLQWSGALAVGEGARESRDKEGFHLRLFHAITPETESSSFYFWSASNGYRQDDPAASEELYNEIAPTFVEDKLIMEAQQERIDLNPDRKLVGIRADSALSLARLALKEMIDEEAESMAVAAE